MTTRRVLAVGAVLVLVSLAIILLRNDDTARQAASPAPLKTASVAPAPKAPNNLSTPASSPASSVIPLRESLEGQPALVPPQLGELSTTESPSLAGRLGAPNTTPEQEARVVLDLLKMYRRLFGAYPAGENNRELVNALLGANKEKLPLVPHDHPRLNAKGELVDAWATPFFFHQNSRNSIEVRSAGADRLLYTDDDIVAGKRPPHPEPSPSGDDPLNG